jgi:mannose-6-phosphate isomerase-like protein (cupin superfamily)
MVNFYKGAYKKDAQEGGHGGWLLGSFMEYEPLQNKEMEIKYWEYPIGTPIHDTKISSILECTFILEGEIVGMVDNQLVTLQGGDYIVIPKGIPNNLLTEVKVSVKGLTIKAPSTPGSKKVIT